MYQKIIAAHRFANSLVKLHCLLEKMMGQYFFYICLF